MAHPTATSPSSSAWHGVLLASAGLPPPTLVTASSTLSRPQYSAVRSEEYLDSPAVLSVKADVLIQLMQAAQKHLVYTGAGISTSAGIQDYASKAAGSVVQAKKAPNMSRLAYIEMLQPTPAHRVLAAMEKAGLVWGWLQQNHDGLAQKAGFPTDKVNEIHGSWLDPKKNPVVQMCGELRSDLFAWMLQMEEECDFVFAVGTSLSGMNADRCAATCAKRFAGGVGQGLAVLSIQRTPMDHMASLRIFAKIDDFMLIVARKLGLKLGTKVHEYVPFVRAPKKLPRSPAKPVAPNDEPSTTTTASPKSRPAA